MVENDYDAKANPNHVPEDHLEHIGEPLEDQDAWKRAPERGQVNGDSSSQPG